MKILKKLASDPASCGSTTVAFLGDSVTHGCFEVWEAGGKMNYTFDPQAVYHNQFRMMLNELFPLMPVNIINAGINGDSTRGGLNRLERDVLAHRPDLTVVCYGLNDVHGDLSAYEANLRAILETLVRSGCEVIFQTPNRMNDYVDENIQGDTLKAIAAQTAGMQSVSGGRMDEFMEKAREVVRSVDGVRLSDAYARWTKLHDGGCDTTALLSNHINHPNRAMHRLFAEELIRVIAED